jgi:hypothetical protein
MPTNPQTKSEQCRDLLQRNPHLTPTLIADHVGCSVSLASRAKSDWHEEEDDDPRELDTQAQNPVEFCVNLSAPATVSVQVRNGDLLGTVIVSTEGIAVKRPNQKTTAGVIPWKNAAALADFLSQ